METTDNKLEGRYYTPPHIVNIILNHINYTGKAILQKHIIDNSCGDGAFLTEIVKRYCIEAFNNNYSKQQLVSELQQYIHGIELNPAEHKKAIANVTKILYLYGIQNIKWDIINDNALTVTKYNNQMDYVVGNPPYIRVHNLNDSYNTIKQFQFAQEGMTDIYIVFYEIGLNMLNDSGALSYITPSSLFNSKAAYKLRKYLIDKKLIDSVIDLQHYQPFKATAYTAIITLYKPFSGDIVYYYIYNPKEQDAQYVTSLTSIKYDSRSFYINGNFYFGSQEDITQLHNIFVVKPDNQLITVKNGYATLLDKFFIGDYDNLPYTIPIIKASTAKYSYCIFPYDENGNLIPYDVLTQDKQLKKHYEEYETQLKKRSITDKNEWYGFGRTQAIKDTFKNKYSLSNLIKTPDDLKLTHCKPGIGVYGGHYILTDIPLNTIQNILYTNDFMHYVKMLAKYKNGGYYTFSTNDLNIYLHYMLNSMYIVSF